MFIQKKKLQKNMLLYIIAIVVFIGICIGINYSDTFNAETYKPYSAVAVDAISLETDRNETEQVISGDDDDSVISIDEFTELKYITNKKYFLDAPKHASNDSQYNVAGVCTTVAMQLLLGYHNYYSDRRLIPNNFLYSDYGNLIAFPIDEENSLFASEDDRKRLGTDDSLFMELYDLSTWPEFPLIGQSIYNIADAANAFVDEYASEISDNVTIIPGTFSQQTAMNEINNGRPLILGFEPVFSGADTYHVVVAYGYAQLDGEVGFLVHYGYGSEKTQVWVPSSWFGFQITMTVNHTHDFVDTGNNFARLVLQPDYRVLHCNTCGAEMLDRLYLIDESEKEITGVNYPISGEIEIPATLYYIDIEGIGEYAFENEVNLTTIKIQDDIKTIGAGAFKGCSNLETISIEPSFDNFGIIYIGNNAFENCYKLSGTYSLQELEHIGDAAFKNCSLLNQLTDLDKLEFIGTEAFYNCASLQSISLPATLNNVGEKAFTKCVNLDISVSNANTQFYAADNILYNKDMTTVMATGQIDDDILFADSVTNIGSYAFAENNNLQSVHFNNSIIIGTSAFENCENLENVYFYSVYTPQVDTNAFASDEFNLYVPYNYQSDYGVVFSEYNANIDSLEMQVQFVVDGTVLGTQDVMYGSLVNYPTIPTKEGYTFEGWVDSNGEKYIDAAGNGIKLVDKTEDFILEPDWAIKSYKIKINGNGFVTWLGPNGLSEDECEIEYGTIISSINLIAEFKAIEQGYKEGYIFDHFEYDDQTLNWTSIPDLGTDGTEVEIIPQWIEETHTIYFNTLCSSTIAEITKQYGENISIPTGLTNTGYHFAGWYQNSSYTGGEVDWATMPDLTPKTADNTYTAAQNNGSVQLYAKWEQISYNVIYNANGGTGSMAASQHLYHEEKQLNSCTFDREGYYFIGWSRTNNNEVEFEDRETVKGLTEESSITLYACWEAQWFTFYCHTAILNDEGSIELLSSTPFDVLDIEFGQSASTEAPTVEGYVFKRWAKEALPMSSAVDGIHITITFDNIPGALDAFFVFAIYEKDSCVAEGSMITLADGSQKAVEDLTGEEMLLVWNMLTGEFDSAPIVFIDSEPERYYEVINLYFSDGTTVKVISEHAFWDINLNKYVYLRSDAAQYIGHWFNKQTVDENGNMVYTEVQLTNVVVQQEYTSAWSPVTYGHLCYYVNGMLSMPGGITGLFNIFEVDPETMTIDQEAYLEDVEEYGLFTYEEFNALCPIPETVFNAFGGQYLKVSLGKGLITWEELENLISRYSEFWN